MRHITVDSFKEVVQAEAGNTAVDFINVCTPAEYKEKHIEGVRNVPLDKLSAHVNEFANKQTVYVHCRSGRRAEQAIATLESLGVKAELVNVEGGLLAWDQAGLPTRSLTTRIPIMRQTLLVAGLLILGSMLLGMMVEPLFYLIAFFVGAGLTFAGATGWCGMSFVLAKMPWNK
ncbi:MAG TPA: rhodanese-like domain-containing protein [Candidatus Paceibacterota bacterium]